jgi:peptide/nickel transport system permease protein
MTAAVETSIRSRGRSAGPALVRFIATRASGGLLTLLLALTIAFFLARAAGDPARQVLGSLASDQAVAALNKQLGYDRPLALQYVSFIGDTLTGNFGESLRYSRANLTLILERFPATLQLTAAALLIAIVVGGLLGLLSALRQGSLLDRIANFGTLVLLSLPLFWLGLMLAELFAVRLQLLPAGGHGEFRHLILPAVTLSGYVLGQIARLTRASMISVLREPYIALARAHGIGATRIAFVHALRNAALPVVTLIGVQSGMLMSGAVTVEFVFAWPGIGLLTTDAVLARDVPLVQALVVFGAIMFVAINLVVDITYAAIDPRTRAPRHG